VNQLKEPLELTIDLVDLFSKDFDQATAHDKSLKTKKRLRAIASQTLTDLNELYGILRSIDPDIIRKWKQRHADGDAIELN
jgi:hypothetical protein